MVERSCAESNVKPWVLLSRRSCDEHAPISVKRARRLKAMSDYRTRRSAADECNEMSGYSSSREDQAHDARAVHLLLLVGIALLRSKRRAKLQHGRVFSVQINQCQAVVVSVKQVARRAIDVRIRPMMTCCPPWPLAMQRLLKVTGSAVASTKPQLSSQADKQLSEQEWPQRLRASSGGARRRRAAAEIAAATDLSLS